MSKARELAEVIGKGLFHNPVSHVASEGQTTFSATYQVGHLRVSLNGIELAPSDYVATNGTSVVLNAAAELDDIVAIEGQSAYAVADAASNESVDAKISAGLATVDYPVTSVNGQTGDVTVVSGVTSVNGQSGAVTLPIPTIPTVCKTYRHSWTGNVSVGNGNAVHVYTFPAQTIQSGKNVEMYLRLPARNDDTSWGGLYVNINCRVNGGTWYNFGNGGYDGNVMEYGQSISTSHHQKLLDFISNAGVSASSSYTVQFEIYARSYSGTCHVGSGSHDINKTTSNLSVRGGLAAWGSDQNHTTLILREVDR